MLKAVLSFLGFRKHEFVETAWEKRIAAALRAAGFATVRTEYVIADDGARIDILMDDYAVEIDWSPKWAEGVGQALYYARRTGRKPAVILLLEPGHNANHLRRANEVASCVTPRVSVWTFDTATGVLDMDERHIKVV